MTLSQELKRRNVVRVGIACVLARIPELKVTARTSAFSYKGSDATIAQIARELGVSHVLEGSVRKSGNAVRVTAQLIEAGNEFHLWSATYDRELTNFAGAGLPALTEPNPSPAGEP